MKISSSEVAFNSQHQKESVHEYRSARMDQGTQWNLGVDERMAAQGSQVDISYDGRIRSEQSSASRGSSVVTRGDQVQHLQLNKNVSEIVSGVLKRDVSVRDVQTLAPEAVVFEPVTQPVQSVQALAYESIQSLDALIISTLTGEEPVGTSFDELNLTDRGLQISADLPMTFRAEETRVRIDQSHHFKEEERLQVASQGRVTTADGREINFMLELDMNRSFELEERLQQESLTRAMIDPLVINLSGGAASLTSTSFSFDLDADGTEEDISFVAGGSGFLALDLNEDGQINDGSELFGTQGTEGFAHLAKYDGDGNRWIDENDEVFSKLKVWTRDENGQDQLMGLKEAGVGAIHLGSTASSFDLTDSENNLLGQVKRSGVFLMESGQVASIQELDLAVHDDANSAATFSLEAEFNAAAEGGGRGMLSRESERPGIIEIMLPPPDRNAGPGREQDEAWDGVIQEFSQRTAVDTKGKDEEEPDEDLPRVFQLDQSVLDVMGRLREKTTVQEEQESDQFSHMKAIIEDLNQQRKHHQAELEQKTEPDTQTEPETIRSVL